MEKKSSQANLSTFLKFPFLTRIWLSFQGNSKLFSDIFTLWTKIMFFLSKAEKEGFKTPGKLRTDE